MWIQWYKLWISLQGRSIQLADAQKLISKQRFRRALKVLKELEPGWWGDVHYWLTRSLVERLVGNDEAGKECMETARGCPRYNSDLHEGDFLRDWARSLTRHGDLNGAAEKLAEAAEYHKGADRTAVLKMSNGCLNYARWYIDDARENFREADALWKAARSNGEEITEQWVMDNRFHHLKALVAAWQDVREMAKTITNTDPSFVRRLRTRLIATFGELGNVVDDWFTHRTHR